jgi:hypothetical protein
MAVAIESWEQVLGNTEEETAALILKLEIGDAEEESATNSAGESVSEDFVYAKALWSRELKAYQAIRTSVAASQQPMQTHTTFVLFDCIICQDRFDADHSFLVPCGHHYCDGCLNELFHVAMNDEQAYPPRCCRQTVPFEDVESFLNRGLAGQFAAKKEELDDSKPTYCYVSTCSTYIGQDLKEGDVATCPSCEAQTCIPCKHAVHSGDCEDDKAIEETMKLAESQGWKRCPHCVS